MAVLLAFVLSGCGLLDAGTDDGLPPLPEAIYTPAPAVGEPLTQAQAGDALPTAEQLDWSQGEPTDTSDLRAATVTPPTCAEMVDLVLGRTPTASADRDYTKGRFDPFLSIGISSFADDPPTAADFDAFRSTLDDCTEMNVSGPNGDLTLSVDSLVFPLLGDATVAVRLTGKFGSIPFAMDIATVLVGHNTYAATQIKGGSKTERKAMVAALTATMDNVAQSG